MRGGETFRSNIAFLAVARLPQVAAQIHKSGCQEAACGVEIVVGGFLPGRFAQGGDTPVTDQNSGFGIGIGQAATDNLKAAHPWALPASLRLRSAIWPPMAMDITAIRMAMPLVT